MTYAHQAIFTNMKITDLASKSKPSGYCNGSPDVYCDSGVSGLCVGVPIADVCPNPVGAHVIDTGVITNFEFVDDSAEIKFEFLSFVGLHFYFLTVCVVRSKVVIILVETKNFLNFF